MDDRWTAAAALVDGSRRALFDHVRRQDHPVSREEAAEALGISRGLAAFHLDKLVEAGLLRARYQAPSGRPRGRGRAPKVYEPAQGGLADERLAQDGLAHDGLVITIPERRYRLIAEILADAVVDEPADAAGAARRRARERGRSLGTRLRTEAGGSGVDLVPVLAGLGFEPRPEPDGQLLLLHNCPFHALAARHTALVCGLNHAFLAGLVEGLAATGVRTDLVPRPTACCVTLTRSAAGGPGERGR